MDDSEGPSLQNPGPMEQDHDSDADDEDDDDTAMHMERDVREITNEMCRLSFALGCDPARYQTSLKRSIKTWRKSDVREEALMNADSEEDEKVELMMLEEVSKVDQDRSQRPGQTLGGGRVESILAHSVVHGSLPLRGVGTTDEGARPEKLSSSGERRRRKRTPSWRSGTTS